MALQNDDLLIVQQASTNKLCKLKVVDLTSRGDGVDYVKINDGGVQQDITGSGGLTIDGNVGIGLSDPNRRLNVLDSSKIVARFESTSTDFGGIDLKNANTTADFQVQVAAVGDDLQLASGGTERVRVDSEGNVGIGVQNPTEARLVIGGQNTAGLPAINVARYAADIDNTSDIQLSGRSVLSANESINLNIVNGYFAVHNGGAANTGLNGTTEYFRIDSSGNVGIGTNNPGGKLEVQTANNERIIFDSAGVNEQPRIKLSRDSGADFTIQNSIGIFEILKDSDYIYRYSNDSHRFMTAGVGERMRIDSNGNVGIGIEAPDKKLDVAGAVRATDALITNVKSAPTLATDGTGKVIAGIAAAAPGNGTITVVQPGTTNQTFTVNQSGNTTITLKNDNTVVTPGNGALTVKSFGEEKAASGSFTANQSGASTITLPQIRYGDLSGKPTIPSVPSVGNGALTVKTFGESKSATGSFTANQSGGSTITLPQIRYSDLSGKPTIPSVPSVGNGTITVVQPGTSNQTFTVNQSGNTTITLKNDNTVVTPGNGALTVKSFGHNANATGSFTANQGGASTLTLPQIRYQDLSGKPNVVQSTTVTQIVALTQAAYDALTPAANTLYVITD